VVTQEIEHCRSSYGDKDFEEVVWGNNLFAAVREDGAVFTSPDGASWAKHTTPATNEYLGGITYASSLYVAAGYNGLIITSPDGTNWTSRISGTTALLFHVAYANGTFVVAGDGGTFVTSPDGVNWVVRSSGTTEHLLGVAFGDNTFLADGNNGTLITLGNTFSSLISVQPQSYTRTAGDDVTFTAAASDCASPTYQWQFDGGNLRGETNATLTLQDVTTNEAGYYAVVVQDTSGTQISQTATLTVNPPPMRPVLTVLPLLSGSLLQLKIADEIGRNYRIQASTDLINWADLKNYYSTDSTILFQDSRGTQFQRRFYRVVTP
jgi:hypothetical protein